MESQALSEGDVLLRVREVAERLALSPATVWRLTTAGDLAHVKIGSATRWASSDVQAFIDRAKGAEA